MKKEERAAKKQREDQALSRVLWWFGGAVVLEFFLLLLNRFFVNFDTGTLGAAFTIYQALRILVWVSLAASVACGAWWGVQRFKKGKTFLAGVCFLASLAVLACAFISSVWKAVGVQFLYITVPAAAVLALIYYLYQREFFFVAVEGAVALFALWGYRRLIWSQPVAVYVIFIAAAAATAAAMVCVRLLQRGDGKLGKVRLLGKKANYAILYVSGGVTALALAAALLLGVTVAYVALFLVVAWLFAAAVYYTVRLM